MTGHYQLHGGQWKQIVVGLAVSPSSNPTLHTGKIAGLIKIIHSIVLFPNGLQNASPYGLY